MSDEPIHQPGPQARGNRRIRLRDVQRLTRIGSHVVELQLTMLGDEELVFSLAEYPEIPFPTAVSRLSYSAGGY